MTSPDLEARITQVEDRIAIEQLVLRYGTAIDASDFDAIGPMFSAEARFAGGKSRDEVVDRLRAGRSSHGRTIHTPHSVLLEFLDADHATGIVPTSAELGIDGQTFVSRMRYEDEYVREDGAWQFSRRKIRYQYALPLGQLSDALIGDLPVRWPGAPPSAAS